MNPASRHTKEGRKGSRIFHIGMYENTYTPTPTNTHMRLHIITHTHTHPRLLHLMVWCMWPTCRMSNVGHSLNVNANANVTFDGHRYFHHSATLLCHFPLSPHKSLSKYHQPTISIAPSSFASTHNKTIFLWVSKVN